MQEDYPAMAGAAKKAIEIEEGNAMAHYLLGKADNGQGDGIMCIAHLTKAIVLKDDLPLSCGLLTVFSAVRWGSA